MQRNTFKLYVLGLALCALCGIIFTSCEDEDTNWTLVWQDEFDGAAGSIDYSKWVHDLGTGSNGWGNNELQYYTDSLANIRQDGDGHLIITARQEQLNGSPYTSARIKTQGIYEFTYGRVEARIKLPYGQGLWPAFWLLGANISDVSWPQCGEIDIMENRGQEPTKIQGSMHGPGYSGAMPVSDSWQLINSRYDTEFHLFAIEWFEDHVDFFVDDNLYQRINKEDVSGTWVFDHPFFIILNVAVGGDYVGAPASYTSFPQELYCDYVRVYRAD